MIGLFLVSIHGSEIDSSNVLMEYFWVLLLVLFAVAFLFADGLGYLEPRIDDHAASS